MLELPQERLHALFDYNPDTGVLTWKERPVEDFATSRGWNVFNAMYAGAEAGSLYQDQHTQYRNVKIDSRNYKAHRLIWAWVHGEYPEQIDHISTHGFDNRLVNLRASDSASNNRNCNRQTNNTSGVTGVFWNKQTGQWQAQINVNGKHIHLGLFTNLTEAYIKRWEANVKYGYDLEHGTPQRQNHQLPSAEEA